MREVKRRLFIVAAIAVLALATIAGPALAQPPPPPHDHMLTVPGTGEKIQVGPPRCTLGDTVQRGFENFHFNVHVGSPGEVLQITAVFC